MCIHTRPKQYASEAKNNERKRYELSKGNKIISNNNILFELHIGMYICEYVFMYINRFVHVYVHVCMLIMTCQVHILHIHIYIVYCLYTITLYYLILYTGYISGFSEINSAALSLQATQAQPAVIDIVVAEESAEVS